VGGEFEITCETNETAAWRKKITHLMGEEFNKFTRL
jgi:hypothetical protein